MLGEDDDKLPGLSVPSELRTLHAVIIEVLEQYGINGGILVQFPWYPSLLQDICAFANPRGMIRQRCKVWQVDQL